MKVDIHKKEWKHLCWITFSEADKWERPIGMNVIPITMKVVITWKRWNMINVKQILNGNFILYTFSGHLREHLVLFGFEMMIHVVWNTLW